MMFLAVEDAIRVEATSPSVIETVVGGFLLAVAASALTLLGNSIFFRVQSRAKVREELRQFVRDLHQTTVATVVDLDLLIRLLRASALTGNMVIAGRDAKQIIGDQWDDDLLRRMRHLRYGHPDPDVRRSAEQAEDAMWPMLVEASRDEDEGETRDQRQARRSEVVNQVTTAMAAFRLAVYNAPRRDVPRKHRYSGQDLPSYLARSMHGVEATTEFPDRGWVAGSIHRVRTVLARLRRG